jgi:hypothetical protein
VVLINSPEVKYCFVMMNYKATAPKLTENITGLNQAAVTNKKSNKEVVLFKDLKLVLSGFLGPSLSSVSYFTLLLLFREG